MIGSGWTQTEIDAVKAVRERHRRLRDLDLDRVDLVGAGANQGALVALMKSAGMIPISKVDDERHRVYGFASVSTVKGQPLVDAHGDVIEPAELEEAAARFRGAAGLNHQGDPIGSIFESVYIDATKARAMGLSMPDQTFAGWWVGVQLAPGPIWEQVKSGALPAFSIQGKAVAEPVAKDRSHYQPVFPPAGNPERERFLAERAEAIRRGPGPVLDPAVELSPRQLEVVKARQKLARLSEEGRQRHE